MKINRMGAFTIVEFMVVLTIAAIFITLAVPSYYQMIQNNKVTTVANKLSASFNFARMEAVKRGVRVAVCPAGNSSFTACGSNTQWSQGWIVFTDADSNNAIDSTQNLMKIAEAPGGGVSIRSSSSVVSYDGTGFIPDGDVSFSVRASGCTGKNARVLTLSSSGRLIITLTAC